MAQTVDAQLPPEHKVRILDGPFRDFIGTVQGELPVRGQVMVSISFYGRPVPVKLDRKQVKAIE